MRPTQRRRRSPGHRHHAFSRADVYAPASSKIPDIFWGGDDRLRLPQPLLEAPPRWLELRISLRDERTKESDEIRPSVIGDSGYDDCNVRFEILSDSKVVQNAVEMEFVVAH